MHRAGSVKVYLAILWLYALKVLSYWYQNRTVAKNFWAYRVCVGCVANHSSKWKCGKRDGGLGFALSAPNMADWWSPWKLFLT